MADAATEATETKDIRRRFTVTIYADGSTDLKANEEGVEFDAGYATDVESACKRLSEALHDQRLVAMALATLQHRLI